MSWITDVPVCRIIYYGERPADLSWQQGGPQAIILHHEDSQLTSLLEQFTTNAYEQKEIGEYMVIIPK